MVKCPVCGNDNRDNAKFCSHCRAQLPSGAVSTPPPIIPAAPAPPPEAVQVLPGEPDMMQLLALLPDLEIQTTDLQIPLPEIDVTAEIERLTQFSLDEQIKLIQQLEQQLKAAPGGSDAS
jgi:hypothetical protein